MGMLGLVLLTELSAVPARSLISPRRRAPGWPHRRTGEDGADDAGTMFASKLPAALLDLARSAGAQVDLRIDGDLDDEIAAAAWFAASEAIAHALKHAGLASTWLSAATKDCHLVVEVVDDGVGGADPEGRVLRSQAERLATLGGRLQVLADVRGGTRVRRRSRASRTVTRSAGSGENGQ